MSKLNRFLKENKIVKENTFYPATKSLVDEDGSPLLWEIKPLTTKRNEDLRDSCTREVPVKGKPNMYKEKLDGTKYTAKLVAESVVFPDLYDKELQDSYGVMTPEALIMEMIDDPGEYANFAKFITEFNGFTDINDDIEEAKN
jgi:hypothetical protein